MIRLLAQFKRGGLSAAAFAHRQGIGYSTLRALRRRDATKANVGFAEMEWVGMAGPEVVLIVELGQKARMRVSSAEQVGLAAALLQRWEAVC